MIAITPPTHKTRRRKGPTHVQGACRRCGLHHNLLLRDWRTARGRESWPICTRCEDLVYPVRRKCSECDTVLRNGNLDKLCATCAAKKRMGLAIR